MGRLPDRFDLARFVDAQSGVYDDALAELRAGAKRSHWMWFIFPQLAGLAGSAMSRRYAIRSLGEARAFLEHPLLGRRLLECTAVMLSHAGRSAREILGHPDDLKFHSSMTLFAQARHDAAPFAAALAAYFDGVPDGRTLELLG